MENPNTNIETIEKDGQRQRILEGLKLQSSIHNDEELAELVFKKCTFFRYPRESVIIEEGKFTNDLYFILQGKVEVYKDDVLIAEREASQHVGEMAAIDPRISRSATVICSEDCLLGVISEEDIAEISKIKPTIWRNISLELVQRLKQVPAKLFSSQSNTESNTQRKTLFYVFIFLFVCTGLITLLGVINLVSIDDKYLSSLFGALLLEMVGGVIGLFNETDFF